jgi:hypothetical protein
MNANPNEMPLTIPDTFTPIKRNYWVVHEDAKFGQWCANFPRGQMLNLWEQWAFAKEVLQAGQEEGIYRIIYAAPEQLGPNKQPGTYPAYEEASGQSYIECVEKTLREYGKLRFFKDIGACKPSARLCYFDVQGNRVEAEVSFPGELLRELRPDLKKRRGHYTYEDHNPIKLWGYGARVRKREEFSEMTDAEYEEVKFQPVYLGISTHTDIWFPKVWGYQEDVDRILRDDEGNSIFNEEGDLALRKPEWEDMSGWFNNRELAQCHTPRFNNFIQRVRQITLNYGGVCHLCDE